MAATCTRATGEAGSLRPVGAGYAEAEYDLAASGGTTSLAAVKTPFTEVRSVRFEPKTAAGSGYWTANTTTPTAVDLTFTANFVGKVFILGRGM